MVFVENIGPFARQPAGGPQRQTNKNKKTVMALESFTETPAPVADWKTPVLSTVDLVCHPLVR